MGWSCSVEASDTLDRFTKVCLDSTGMSNTYKTSDGKTYMLELSRREYEEGHITGKICQCVREWKGYVASADSIGYAVNPTSFRINGYTGEVERGPAWFKKLLKSS